MTSLPHLGQKNGGLIFVILVSWAEAWAAGIHGGHSIAAFSDYFERPSKGKGFGGRLAVGSYFSGHPHAPLSWVGS